MRCRAGGAVRGPPPGNVSPLLRDQGLVREPLPNHTGCGLGHHHFRVLRTHVVASGELVHVSVKMLGGDMMEGPRFRVAQKLSIPLVWAMSRTYSPTV